MDNDRFIDFQEVLFTEGSALVEVFVLFYADDRQTYGAAGVGAQYAIAAALDGIAKRQVAASPSATPTKAAVKAGKTSLLSVRGQGNHTTRTLSAPTAWDLTWSYDCSRLGSRGKFSVVSRQANGKASAILPLVQMGTKGHGVEHYHHGGKLYLEIASPCSWALVVKST